MLRVREWLRSAWRTLLTYDLVMSVRLLWRASRNIPLMLLGSLTKRLWRGCNAFIPFTHLPTPLYLSPISWRIRVLSTHTYQETIPTLRSLESTAVKQGKGWGRKRWISTVIYLSVYLYPLLFIPGKKNAALIPRRDKQTIFPSAPAHGREVGLDGL